MIEQVDDLAVLDRQGLHGLPDKGEIVALVGGKLLIQFVRFPYGIVAEPVLAEVCRDAQQPCLFVRGAFKRYWISVS